MSSSPRRETLVSRLVTPCLAVVFACALLFVVARASTHLTPSTEMPTDAEWLAAPLIAFPVLHALFRS